MATKPALSGIPALDEIVQGLRMEDNVVWQVDTLDDYIFFAEPFAQEGIAQGYPVVYLRFAPHAPVLSARPGVEIVEVDPRPGFDYFSRTVHQIIEERGKEVLYVFDNLSALVNEWATDELLANFFQVTCPYLFELDTVAYFALTRGRHAHSAVARIRDTTQVLIDVYHVNELMYLHPLKVWDRYSPQMFLPHRVAGTSWSPVSQSGAAAELSVTARRNPLQKAIPSIAPWESVYHKLIQYSGIDEDCREITPEMLALEQELLHMLIGNHPEFRKLADCFFSLDDILSIRERLIGSGRIGGKAAGMLLARRMLLSVGEENGIRFSQVMEDHDSFFIGSDVFFTFLVRNDLFRLRLQLTRASHITHEEYEDVQRRFLAGTFPTQIVEQFRNMLDYFGQAPIIVRSSSLLEDSFGNAFAGKYRSEFRANQGTPDERLESFMEAVKLVYASALNPHALTYRRHRGLGENDEQMAILVQRVAGMPHGRYFFPSLAGVAFSRNLYAWSERINPQKGVIRLVYGLGTRAVDRVDTDYPRMVAVSHPRLRPEVGLRVARYSQRQVDLLDLEENTLTTCPVSVALESPSQPDMHLLVSVLEEGDLLDPVSNYLAASPRQMVLTFNNLLARTQFIKIIDAMLTVLEHAYGRPVDTEFTASVDEQGQVRVNILQCRPLHLPGSTERISSHTRLAKDRVLFRSSHLICGGVLRDIRYILYIDPQKYSAITDADFKRSLGRIVGRINEHPYVLAEKIIMMGPGRWGSSNIDLGVNVGYADINNAAMLVEVAREEAGHLPEVSYGTHFFLDLVESRIIFLAVYPDEAVSDFRQKFFTKADNVLTSLLPDAGAYEDVVKLIDVEQATGGMRAQVIADAEARKAVCFIHKPTAGGNERAAL